jgi:hypothetical protein
LSSIVKAKQLQPVFEGLDSGFWNQIENAIGSLFNIKSSHSLFPWPANGKLAQNHTCQPYQLIFLTLSNQAAAAAVPRD